MHFRTASPEDIPRLIKLYQAVARGGGIAREETEISEGYVGNFINRSLTSGLIIVAENERNKDELVAEIHAYKPGIKVFDHVLSDLTILVHPAFQGKRIGRTIFMIFLDEIARTRRDVGKVELFTSEHNTKAISLYQSLGFQIEGRMEMRFRSPTGTYEADIPMGWQNPGFEFDGSIPRLEKRKSEL